MLFTAKKSTLMAAVADESTMTDQKQPQQPHDDYIKKKWFWLDFQENAHLQQSPHSDSDFNSFQTQI